MNAEMWVVLALQVQNSFEKKPRKLLLHVAEFSGIVTLCPQNELIFVDWRMDIQDRIATDNEQEGFTEVVALLPLLLDSEHHAIFQELTILHDRHVTRAQSDKIDRGVHVHSPSCSLLNVFS